MPSALDRHAGRIDLLLTDMVMPEGISGMELAERLMLHQPGLKIIFTSGYTAHDITPEALARTQGHFLQKPYVHAASPESSATALIKEHRPKRNPCSVMAAGASGRIKIAS